MYCILTSAVDQQADGTPLVNTTTFPDMGKMVECVFQSMMSLFILPLRLTVQACFSARLISTHSKQLLTALALI